MNNPVSMRDAYGKALLELGEANPKVVVLDSDISNSSKTVHFGQKFPDRFFNFGIQEANMVDVAAGMATTGLIPFANTFSFLATLRAGEQIRTSIAYNSLNVKIIGSYSGLSDSYDGASHQSVFDIAVMRSMPNMNVVAPCDSIETAAVIKAAAEIPAPFYVRLCRNELPEFFDENYEFVLGKAKEVRTGGDVTLVVTGIMLHRALQAAEELDTVGIQCRILHMPSLKPFDARAVSQAAEETGALVSIEEHNILGGLGAAVAEVLTATFPVPLERVGIPDTFAESGDYDELLDKYGMSHQDIVSAAHRVLERKQD